MTITLWDSILADVAGSYNSVSHAVDKGTRQRCESVLLVGMDILERVDALAINIKRLGIRLDSASQANLNSALEKTDKVYHDHITLLAAGHEPTLEREVALAFLQRSSADVADLHKFLNAEHPKEGAFEPLVK